jgi:hypothetical protein
MNKDKPTSALCESHRGSLCKACGIAGIHDCLRIDFVDTMQRGASGANNCDLDKYATERVRAEAAPEADGAGIGVFLERLLQ